MTKEPVHYSAPATAREVAAALEARGLSALRRFGQHFLLRRDLVERMILAAELEPCEVVLEVGPGLGILTERLIHSGAKVVAVEIDRGLADFLKSTFASQPGFELLHRDVMERKSSLSGEVRDALATAGKGSFKVVSNLPYSISSPFLAACLVADPPPSLMVVMVQREVARVLLAKPGGEDWSALSASVQLFADVTRIAEVPPSAFHPMPEVHSTVVRIRSKPRAEATPARIVPFVRALLASRRKTLRAVLPKAALTLRSPSAPAIDAVAILSALGIDPGLRAETLGPTDLERLALAVLAHPG